MEREKNEKKKKERQFFRIFFAFLLTAVIYLYNEMQHIQFSTASFKHAHPTHKSLGFNIDAKLILNFSQITYLFNLVFLEFRKDIAHNLNLILK